MGFSEAYQQSNQAWPNAQGWSQGNPLSALFQGGFGHGIGQAAYGGQGGYGPFGQQGWGAQGGQGSWGQGGWGQQRQLSHYDVGEVVRQLLPLLPHVVAQAQQQPQAAFGYGQGGFGQGGFGQGGPGQGGNFQSRLSQQDIGEVVRHILPILPQVVTALQGQQGPYAASIYGNWPGQHAGQQQWGFGQQSGPFGPLQAAFGRGQSGSNWGGAQLNQADVGEVVRQLTAVIPQVIANLQAQQQQQQRGAGV
jgi:hypothetical protein